MDVQESQAHDYQLRFECLKRKRYLGKTSWTDLETRGYENISAILTTPWKSI